MVHFVSPVSYCIYGSHIIKIHNTWLSKLLNGVKYHITTQMWQCEYACQPDKILKFDWQEHDANILPTHRDVRAEAHLCPSSCQYFSFSSCIIPGHASTLYRTSGNFFSSNTYHIDIWYFAILERFCINSWSEYIPYNSASSFTVDSCGTTAIIDIAKDFTIYAGKTNLVLVRLLISAPYITCRIYASMSAPGGPHVGHMNLAIWDDVYLLVWCSIKLV